MIQVDRNVGFNAWTDMKQCKKQRIKTLVVCEIIPIILYWYMRDAPSSVHCVPFQSRVLIEFLVLRKELSTRKRAGAHLFWFAEIPNCRSPFKALTTTPLLSPSRTLECRCWGMHFTRGLPSLYPIQFALSTRNPKTSSRTRC